MADYKQLFKTTDNKNWLKVVVAIHITKTGLSDFVSDAAVKLQDKIINDIQQGTNLQTGTRCNKCNACPEANCEKFREMIKTCHRFHGPKSGPSWKNTHPNDWCTKPWEVAKCFFPGDGYRDKLNAQETDFNGIVGFILNSTTFDGQTGENLSDIKGNKFSKCRHVVNLVRHSATLEVKDADRKDYITQLKNLLTSGAVLQNNTKANDAHGQLTSIYTYGNDEEFRPFVRMCLAGRSSQFSWTIYLMEGTLLAFGAFLAWETRHVTFAALNDSREIGLCLYNVVILSAVGLTLSLLLDEQEVVLYGVTSGCIIIGTTLTQLIVFIPKVRAVYYGIDGTEATVLLRGTSSHVFSVQEVGIW